MAVTTELDVFPSVPPDDRGDVTQTGEQPLFEQTQEHAQDQQLDVIINVSYARHEKGARAMRVVNGNGEVLLSLTAAQAHQLAVDLSETADYLAGKRQAAGYKS